MANQSMKHTPGPWWTDGEYDEEEMGIPIIAARTDAGPLPGNPTRGMVAWASEILPENAARCAANARLIAMAPDMFMLLNYAVTQSDAGALELFFSPEWARKARAAIAKATGENQP